MEEGHVRETHTHKHTKTHLPSHRQTGREGGGRSKRERKTERERTRKGVPKMSARRSGALEPSVLRVTGLHQTPSLLASRCPPLPVLLRIARIVSCRPLISCACQPRRTLCAESTLLTVSACVHAPDMSQMRKIIIEMVLATDMAEHQRVVSLLRSDLPSRLGKQGPSTGKAAPRSQPEAAPAAKGAAPGVDEGTLDEKGVSLMLCGAIKIADLGHSFAQFDVHRRWSQQLEAELFAQVFLCFMCVRPSCCPCRALSLSSISRVATWFFFREDLAWSRCERIQRRGLPASVYPAPQAHLRRETFALA